MHPFERWTLRRYLATALRYKSRERIGRRDEFIAGLEDWNEAHGQALGLPRMSGKRGVRVAKPSRRRFRSSDCDDPAQLAERRAAWEKWRAAVFKAAEQPRPATSPLQERIDWLSDLCALNPSQRYLIGLLARIDRSFRVRGLVGSVSNVGCLREAFDYNELRPLLEGCVKRGDLSANGLLVRFGLIDKDDSENVQLSELVVEVLAMKSLSGERVRGLLLGRPATATLPWNDFAHLGALRDLAARLAASQEGKSCAGTNILIYGPPGTGKSEFVKSLAAHLGLCAHFVGERNNRDAEPNRQERVAALMIANALGATGKKIIVAVDEADDLFAGVDENNAATRHGSKVFMNRLVERVAAPTIWIVNDIERLGPAVVRRMNLVMRFPKPSLAVRKNMIERISDRADFRLAAEEAARLARISATPALIENAIRSAARIGGSGAEAQKILECGLEAMGAGQFAAAPSQLDFDPALSSADVDLVTLAERARTAPTRALSFCLSGVPGTGKSAYARYLAGKLELEPLEKRYSDLISSYLGESEKAIARAFEEAADLRAFLILDEADSLLRDRGAARHTWEITQVNEMLTQMERHRYPFACTTNAPELLDPATARRFLFKVRFLPMTSDQIAAAFRRAFGMICPEFVLRLDSLTPGDFAVVARKAEVFGERDPLRLGRWLDEEVAAKTGIRKRRIGF